MQRLALLLSPMVQFPYPLEPLPKNSGKSIGDSGGKAGELDKHAATQAAQGVWTNHHRGADETHDNAGTLLGRQLFIGRQHMCDKDRKQRRRRIQDGCQTTSRCDAGPTR